MFATCLPNIRSQETELWQFLGHHY